ncbi:DUF2750 domain-containing protein [Micromonospora sp. NPDC050276]|uniref:DUF2750 domain-containing protein n=1 Tax=Micromonospora sp. NPDC050276 TaxID=3364278 RepID=UPI0037BD8CCC
MEVHMGRFPMDRAEAEKLRAKTGASRMIYSIRSFVEKQALWAWGDEEGTLFMQDAQGTNVLPVWPDPLLAEIECAGPSGEAPVEVSLERFLEVWLPQLEVDSEGIAIFPVDDRIAVSMTTAEFRAKVFAAGRRADEVGP